MAGVRVFVGDIAANLYYVSPGQVNFLIPSLLRPGDANVWIAREGTAGPEVRITLLETAPGLFQQDTTTVVAAHANGQAITKESPSRPGETVVLYAVGLGRTDPDVISGQIASLAAPIRRKSDLQVLLGGTSLDASRIAYAGVAPGFAGLYQINLRLPEQLGTDPEIRLSLAGQSSPAELKLPSRPAAEQ